jgi:hypothetical protein
LTTYYCELDTYLSDIFLRLDNNYAGSEYVLYGFDGTASIIQDPNSGKSLNPAFFFSYSLIALNVDRISLESHANLTVLVS